MSALVKIPQLAIEQDQIPPKPSLKLLANDPPPPLPDIIYIERRNWFNNPSLLDDANFERYEQIISNQIDIKQSKIDFVNNRIKAKFENNLAVFSCPHRQELPLFVSNYTKQRKRIKRTFNKLARTEFAKRKYRIFPKGELRQPYLVPNVRDSEQYESKRAELIAELIIKGHLPQDYYRRLTLRQLAQGKAIAPYDLIKYGIVFFYDFKQPDIVAYEVEQPDPSPQEPTTDIPRLKREHRQPNSPFDFVLIEHSDWQQYDNMKRLYDKLPSFLPLAKSKKEPTNRYIDKQYITDYAYFTPNRRGTKSYIHCIVFDQDPIDKNGDLFSNNFFRWADVGLPPPNLIIANPVKHGSYQLIYFLIAPIRTDEKHPCTRQMDWLNRITKRMTALLGADPAFNSGRSKNPFSNEHDLYVSGAEPYTLQELSDKCDLVLYEQEQREIARNAPISISATTLPPKGVYAYTDPMKASNAPKFGKGVFTDMFYWRYGRNGQAFEHIRWKAYSKAYLTPHDLELYILNEYHEYQANFKEPMPDYDIRASVKSILKYCINTFGEGQGKLSAEFKAKMKANNDSKSNHAQALFSIRQRNRVNVRWSGYDDKQAQALEMLSKGIKQVDICRELSIGKMTLHRWKKASEIK